MRSSPESVLISVHPWFYLLRLAAASRLSHRLIAILSPVPAVLRLSLLDARRFHRRALLLDDPAPDLSAALAYHQFVQIDPINVCGRMHDLILRNRVVGYREGDLMKFLHGDPTNPLPAAQRAAFEQHLPRANILAALTLEAWPYLLSAMRRRSRVPGSWSGEMDARQRSLAKTILAEISARGPLSSDDIDDDQRDHQGWGAHASLAKTTLHKLFFHGRVLIVRRVGTRRYYDLPERILPAATIAAKEPTTPETERWLTLLKLRQRRLVTLSATETRSVMDLVQAIEVEGCPPLYCLRADLPLMDSPAGAPCPIGARPSSRAGMLISTGAPVDSHHHIATPGDGRAAVLLAPLDPLIYDRRLTRQLWQFDYTWEVYTPPAKRIRGYYALPVLAGLQLVGHVDPKADRKNNKLIVANRSIRRGHKVATAVRALKSFLSLR